jgi:hypothetical protein
MLQVARVATPPELSAGVAWLQSIAASALLFVSALVHEFSHALVARQHGAVAPGASAWTAYLALSRSGAPRIAVVDEGRLVGVVIHAGLRNLLAADTLQSAAGQRAA